MLDSETKRRIDSCRDILVGKVPDPKSQVEQITIALIYKFMDDMDAEAEELGGKRSFFAGDYARFGWARLMSPSLGGFEVLALYSEAIQKMNENPGVPTLFRDIFKNAYLPYRDPETLKSFLKEINYFTYDHSERLGDAFEYLLSVLGSQGDAGQFRTPRHIIDFMVEVLDPKKNETILDPACGTAGFLISAWKHILKSNTSKKGESSGRAGDLLTPDERARLAASIHGYDISPDMVRLSLVNLYLHGFTDPRIEEYDTLTSDDKWNEVADVILANPPFMSPKGGIKPHKRFTVAATRSEVLFVDYMAEHLTATGRAAIVVPEGIIFQSGTAYKALRKLLVDTSLVAVVSLPAGVFNPYSGVKTSILILDKRLHKHLNSVLFVKVGNDGFNLGAQRRVVVNSDLPEATRLLKGWMMAPEKFEGDGVMAQAVERTRLGENGDFNLSGERYLISESRHSSFPVVSLGDVALIQKGSAITKKDTTEGIYPVIAGGQQPAYFHNEFNRNSNTITVSASGAYAGFVSFHKGPIFASDCSTIRPVDDDQLLAQFLFQVLKAKQENIYEFQVGGAQPHVYAKDLREVQIPLPPLEVQNQIVAEIEGYQKIIDGARQVLDNYKPQILVKPEWPTPRFEAAPFQIIDGDRGANYPSKTDFSSAGHCLFLNTKNVRADGFRFDEMEFITTEKDAALRKGKLQRGDVLLTTRGTIGNTAHYNDFIRFDQIRINSGMLIFRPDATKLDGAFLFHFFQSENFRLQREAIVSGAAQPQLPIRSLHEVYLPLPDLPTQRAIVAEIEAEQALVNANRELIRRMEAKVKAAIDQVWGESV